MKSSTGTSSPPMVSSGALFCALSEKKNNVPAANDKIFFKLLIFTIFRVKYLNKAAKINELISKINGIVIKNRLISVF
jgi:hypothetical protein